MMGRSFERDNINFIQTQVRNSFSRNLKDIYIYTEISFTLLKIILLRRYRFSKREILLQKSLNFFTIENIAIWISSLSTNPPRKFDIEGDTSLLCNKLGIGTLRNHFHISSYRSLFHRFLLASNEISFTLLNSRRGYEPSKISQWNWLIKKEIESILLRWRHRISIELNVPTFLLFPEPCSIDCPVHNRTRRTNARGWIIKLDSFVIRQTRSRQASKSLCQSFPREWKLQTLGDSSFRCFHE